MHIFLNAIDIDLLKTKTRASGVSVHALGIVVG